MTCAASKEDSRWFSGDELADLSLSCKSRTCLAVLRCEPEVGVLECCCVCNSTCFTREGLRVAIIIVVFFLLTFTVPLLFQNSLIGIIIIK